MIIRKTVFLLLLSGMAVAAVAQNFGCTFNFATGQYKGRTETDMIELYSGKTGTNYWAGLWEAKKLELQAAFVESFNRRGQQWGICTGEFPQSPYQINVNILNLDPDGEVSAEIFAFRVDSASKNIQTFLDKLMNGGGGSNSVYTQLSTSGFKKLGFKAASELCSQMDDLRYQEEKVLRKQERAKRLEEKANMIVEQRAAKEAARQAAEEALYASNHPNPDSIKITTEKALVESAEFIQKLKVKKYIQSSEEETLVEIYKDLRTQAAGLGANFIYITSAMTIDDNLVVRAMCFKK